MTAASMNVAPSAVSANANAACCGDTIGAGWVSTRSEYEIVAVGVGNERVDAGRREDHRRQPRIAAARLACDLVLQRLKVLHRDFGGEQG